MRVPTVRSSQKAGYGHFSELVNKSTALGISRSGGARNPHVFQYTPVPALRRNAVCLRSLTIFSQALSQGGHEHYPHSLLG